jgi:2-oxoglutarate ferredoxin oxidoreductase subunit delta
MSGPVALDLVLCKACGICIELCPEKVFDKDKQGNPVVARPEECTQCLICELHCPDFAIEVKRRVKKGPAEPAASHDAPDEAPAVAPERLATVGEPCADCGEEA